MAEVSDNTTPVKTEVATEIGADEASKPILINYDIEKLKENEVAP